MTKNLINKNEANEVASLFLYGDSKSHKDGLIKGFIILEMILKEICNEKKANFVSLLRNKYLNDIKAVVENKTTIDSIRKQRNIIIHEGSKPNDSGETYLHLARLLNVLCSITKEINCNFITDKTIAEELKNQLSKNPNALITAETKLKKFYTERHKTDPANLDHFHHNYSREICPICGNDHLYVEEAYIADQPFCFYCNKCIDAVLCDDCTCYRLEAEKCHCCGN